MGFVWKISQPQSIKFISILYDVLFLKEIRHDKRPVVYGRPGFLLPVGVHLKATLGSMWPSHQIHLHLISITTSQQPVFLQCLQPSRSISFLIFFQLLNCFKGKLLFCWQTSNNTASLTSL